MDEWAVEKQGGGKVQPSALRSLPFAGVPLTAPLSLNSEGSLYDRIGPENLHRLVTRFYTHVARHPDLIPIFPADLTLTAPAGAGGGWDSLARSLQDTMMKTGTVKNVQVMNVPGAGGTVGLAQFAQTARGAKDQLLVGGLVMVGAIITNKAPVTLDNVTPIARLTADPMVVVVPKDSPIQSLADLTAKIKSDVGGTVWAGGSAGGADHILAGLITQAAGGDPAKVNYVAYSGGGEALARVHALLAARGLVHRDRPAVHAPQPALALQDGEIAPDGLHGHLEAAREFRAVDPALAAHGARDLLVAFCSEHAHLTDGLWCRTR